MRILRIGFSKSKSKWALFSWAIRKYQGTSYSHVFLEIPHKRLFGVDTVFHSNGDSGVSYYAKPIFEDKNEVTDMYEWQIPDHLYTEIRALTHQKLGHRYAFLQNIGVLLVDIARELGCKMRNPWKKGYNCSEITLFALKKQFPQLESFYDLNTIKPIDIQNIVEAFGFKKLL